MPLLIKTMSTKNRKLNIIYQIMDQIECEKTRSNWTN